MSAHAYTEDQLVEQPAIGLFAELGWQVALPHPHPGPLPAGEGVAGPPPDAGVAGEPADAGLLGRETKGEVVLVGRLRAALEKLNASRLGHDALPREAMAWAKDELTRDLLLPRLLSEHGRLGGAEATRQSSVRLKPA